MGVRSFLGGITGMCGIGRNGPARGGQSGPLVEPVGRTCRAIEAVMPPSIMSAIIEPLVASTAEELEHRKYLAGTFAAFISDAGSGPHSPQTFAVNLWTVGKQATQWHIVWGDGGSNTYLASNQPGGVFPVPFTVSHPYAAQTWTITATATPTSGSAVTATEALYSGFGNVSSQGETVYNPNSGHNSNGKAMAIDSSGSTFSGYIYVASVNGSQAAVTRFTPSGAVDTNFNSSGPTPGTFVLSILGNGTPAAIAVSPEGRWVAVGGQFSGWGVAMIDVTANNGQGGVAWSKPGLASTGQANGIAIENAAMSGNDTVYADGYIVQSCTSTCCIAALELKASDGTVPSTWNGGHGVFAFSTGCNTCSTGTGIVDGEGSAEGLELSGYTTYSGGTSDFTLAKISDSGVLDNGFGSGGVGYVRTNFGNTIGSGNGAVNVPSVDRAYAVAIDAFDNIVVAGETNAMGGGDHVAVALYNPTSGALITGFGPYSGGGITGIGVSVGPAGDAYSVAVNQSTDAIVTGGANSNDIQVCQFVGTGTNEGLLDTSFGAGGVFTIDLGDTSSNSTDVGYSIAFASDGSVIVGGSTTPSGGFSEIAVVDLLDQNSISIT